MKKISNQLEFLESEYALLTRKKYIDTFIDKESEFYEMGICKMHICSDGLCYYGYLWDCFRVKELITEIDALSIIESKENVFAMWDVHTKDRIFIKDYWKYGKENVILTSGKILIKNLKDLPEDIYIFDDTFSWSIALTHEDIEDGRYCLLSRILQ